MTPPTPLIPAKAGNQAELAAPPLKHSMDSRIRGNVRSH